MEQKTCKTSVGAASDHFVDISKMIEFPIGAEAPHQLRWTHFVSRLKLMIH